MDVLVDLDTLEQEGKEERLVSTPKKLYVTIIGIHSTDAKTK